ncbi:Stage V sporulation protein D [Caulifigura coniformis]|uniref:Stage V sporulation protein D n=1 Tax=Caulifigura coniformis TaxID=2527983 RepID=A0A517SGV0_9PLAN|nr:penicillin-binding transpeptidase domain-containing protein [Caulifigura coniformis]QDT55353.1 Stage V sporulation protein D [Caulifigura coniformis]
MSHRPALHWKLQAPVRGNAPASRIRLLALGFGVMLVVVVGRVAHLQGVVADRFVVQWDETSTVLEPIPASHGRIVSSDGVVLAFDRTRFDLSVHYRWLEEPPSARWLSQQARQRLAPRDRRDREKLKQAEVEVLAAREQLWSALAHLTSTSPETLQARRGEIQQRVARMVQSVENRRQAASGDEVAASEPSASEPLSVDRVWKTIVAELTTPPQREKQDPLVLREELQVHPILSDLPLATAAAIESAPTTFPPGVVTIQRRHERIYPGKDLASHVIGVRRSYRPGEHALAKGGEGGVEQAYDAVLRGQDGVRRVVYNRRRDVIDSAVVRPPVEGRDVTLSIVANVQRTAESILEAALASPRKAEAAPSDSSAGEPSATLPRGGTIVAVDVATGDLVAAACAPRFDLNLFNEFDAERWNALVSDPRRPFYPRITAMTAPPGSVFKVLTAVAALEEEIIQPESQIHCRGYLNRPDQLRCMIFRNHGLNHGDVNVSDALCQSCNVFFFEAARKMGDAPLRRWSERFGFGAPTGADLPGEQGGRLPKEPTGGRRTRDTGSTLQLAIGQSSLLVSPLQVARMMAAIANGGILVSPRFAHVAPLEKAASGIQLASFESFETPPASSKLDLSPRTIAVVRESLERVVEDPLGTGRAAAVAGVRVAGKTGTAETGGGQPDHAWFAGYAPADRPRIAFVVMLEHAGSGGNTAGPVARQFVEGLVANGLIRAEDRTRD